MVDQCTPNTAFSHFISSHRVAADCPLVFLSVDSPPLDGGADVSVSAKLEPLEIVFSPYMVQALVSFAKLDDDIVLVDANDAKARVHRLKLATKQKMAKALQTRTNARIDIHLRAPTVKIPRDCTCSDSDMIVLDGGTFRFQNSEPTKTHDVFALSMKDTRAYVHTNGTEVHLLEGIVGKIKISVSARPVDYNVCKLMLDANMGSIYLHASDTVLGLLASIGKSVADSNKAAERHVAASQAMAQSPRLQPAISKPRPLAARGAKTPRPDMSIQASLLMNATDSNEEQLLQWELLRLTFRLEQFQVDVTSAGKEILLLDVSGMEATLLQRPLDKELQFTLQAFEIEDQLRGATLGKQVFLISSKHDGSSASLFQADVFLGETNTTADVRVGSIECGLHLGSIAAVLEISDNIKTSLLHSADSNEPEPEMEPNQQLLSSESSAELAAVDFQKPQCSKGCECALSSHAEGGYAAGWSCELCGKEQEGAKERWSCLEHQEDFCIDCQPRDPNAPKDIDVKFEADTAKLLFFPEISTGQTEAIANLSIRNVNLSYSQRTTTKAVDLSLETLHLGRHDHSDQHEGGIGDSVIKVAPCSSATTSSESTAGDVDNANCLVVVKAVLRDDDDARPSEVTAKLRGLRVALCPEFLSDMLAFAKENPIKKKDSDAAAAATAAAAIAAGQAGYEALPEDTEKMVVKLSIEDIAVQLLGHATTEDGSEVHGNAEYAEMHLGKLEVRHSSVLSSVQFSSVWVVLSPGGALQRTILQPVDGQLKIATEHGCKAASISDLKVLAVHISVRDIGLLQGIGQNYASVVKKGDGEKVAEEDKALDQDVYEAIGLALRGDSQPLDSEEPAPEVEPEPESGKPLMQFVHTEAIVLQFAVFDDSRRSSQNATPVITLGVSLEGVSYKKHSSGLEEMSLKLCAAARGHQSDHVLVPLLSKCTVMLDYTKLATGAIDVGINVPEKFELTLAQEYVHDMLQMLPRWKQIMSSKRTFAHASSATSLRNETGAPFSWTVPADAAHRNTVEPGTEVAISNDSWQVESGQSEDVQLLPTINVVSSKMIYVWANGSVEHCAVSVLETARKEIGGREFQFCCEDLKNGGTVLVVRSLWVIENQTTRTMTVSMKNSAQEWVKEIPPAAKTGIPIGLHTDDASIQLSSGTFSRRRDCHFSAPPSPFSRCSNTNEERVHI